MNEENYKITLADGSIIENLKLNGTNYISSKAVDPNIFYNNCSPVIINDGTSEEIHNYMELVQVTEEDNGEYWFVLRDISSEELSQIKIKSDIEYLAMMTGIEL